MNLSLSTEYPESEKVLFKLKPPQKGLLLDIHYKDSSKNRFVLACFHEFNNIIALADNNANVYVIDYCSGKFWRLQNFNSVTFIAFSNFKREELLLGQITGDILVINFETGLVIEKLKGHNTFVKNISFFEKDLCLTFSDYDAIVWDLTTNTKVQVLNLEENNALKHVTFVPTSCYILACFHDDVIQIWNASNFQNIKQFIPLNWKNYAVKSIAFTKNGQCMVVSSYLPILGFFSLDTWKLVKLITLPEYILTVKHVEFISQPFDGGCNKILAILSGQGIVHFYDIEQNVIISELALNSEVSKFVLCSRGKYIACILRLGDVKICSLEHYILPPVKKQVQKATGFSRIMKEKKIKELKCVKSEIDDVLERSKLESILMKYGEYPEAHRLKIWEKLLELPNNVEQYNSVINHITLNSFQNLKQQYPLESKISLQALKKLLNNIVTWCPFFANVDFLPVFTFPFVKVFQNKPVACFEALCTIFMNWCMHWFEYFPLPPINILAIIENLLLEHDPELLQFFNTNNVTSNLYIWPMLETAFSEIITATEWYTLWDHIFTHEISFLFCAVAAYNITQRSILSQIKKPEEFEFFYHNQQPVDMKKFIKMTYHILNTTSNKLHPRQYLKPFQSLLKDMYPIFIEYPKIILDVQGQYMEIDENLKKINKRKKELLEREKLKVEEERERMIKEEQKKRLKDMEKEGLKTLLSRQNILKSEQEKLQNIKKFLNDTEVGTFSAPNDQTVHKEWETSIKKKYLDQLKLILGQKCKIDELLKDNSAIRRVYSQNELEEKVKRIDRSLLSLDKIKKLSMAASLAILEKVIKNVDQQIEKESQHANKNDPENKTFENLNKEIEILEHQIIKLLSVLSKGSSETFCNHKKPKENFGPTSRIEAAGSKQVKFSESS